MNIVGSPDISVLEIQVTFDISGATPVVSLVNKSVGSNLKGCAWAFVVLSPSRAYIHAGEIANPDIAPSSTAWTTFSITDTWPTNPFNNYQIEWSGDSYVFYAVVKDSLGNIFSSESSAQQAWIVPPPNATSLQKNYFGVASSSVAVKCNEGSVYFENKTQYTYNGYTGTKVSSTLVVTYPPDKNGATQAPFTLLNYSSALVPVTLNSPSYIFTQNAVYTYEVYPNTFIKLNFYLQAGFGVWCNVDLLPLNVVITKYFAKLGTNDFTDMAAAQKRGLLILAEYGLILAGVMQPLSGAIDIPAHIQNIEVLSGFKCFEDCCCGAQSGIVPSSGSSIIGDYNFIPNPSGSINAFTIVPTGNNIQFNINGIVYVVNVTQNSPSDSGIAVTPETVGGTQYYHISVDGRKLAFYLADIIQENSDVYNVWQALFPGTGDFKIAVDGACIFATTSACDYTFGLANIPASTTYAILTSIKIGATTTPLNFSFNQTNLTALQAYLNTLGLGTYVVANTGGGTVGITSTANTNNIQALNYKVGGIAYTADYSRECTGYEEIEAQEAIQNIIYYACNLDDSQVKTSADYTICYIDAAGAKQTMDVAAGQSMAVLFSALLATGCTTIDYIIANGGAGGTNCAAMLQLFPATSAKVDANTIIFGFKNGCAGMSALELFQFMLANMDSTTKDLFCEAIAACGAGLSCEAIDYDILVTEHNTACSNIVGLVYTLA